MNQLARQPDEEPCDEFLRMSNEPCDLAFAQLQRLLIQRMTEAITGRVNLVRSGS